MRTSRLLPFIAAAIALTSAYSPAEAQLGGLMRKAKEKAQDAMKGPAPRKPAPAFDNHVLEITDERIDQLIKGLVAEKSTSETKSAQGRRQWKEREDQAYAQRKQNYDVKMASFNKEQDAWNAKVTPINKCRDAVDRKYASNPRDAKKKSEYDKCGEPPIGPARPDVPEPLPAATEPGDPVEAGVRASGLTSDQYSVMKERVAYLVSIDADFRNAKQSSGYGFTDGEAAAALKRLEELKALKSLLSS